MTTEAKVKIKARADVNNAVSAANKAFSGLKTTLAGVSIAGGAVTGAFALITAQSLKHIDAIGKMSKTYGIATEDLAAFTVAADLGGSSLETFARAARNMSKNTFDFVIRGTGEATDAFEQLGISAEDLRPIMNDNVAVFGLIGDRLNSMEDGAIKTALAVKLLGGRAAELLPALEGGSEQFQKYREEAQQLGIALSGDAVRGVEAANDSMTRLGFLFTGLRDQTTAALAPAIEGLTTDFREWVLSVAESEGGIKNFAQNSAISILEFAKGAVEGFESIIDGIEKAKAQLEDWGLIEKDNSDDAILYQQGVVERIETSIAMYERLGNAGEQYNALLEAREVNQIKLNELTGGEVDLFDRTVAGIDAVIAKIKERQAAEASGATTGPRDSGSGNNPALPGEDNSAYLDQLSQRYEALQNELASEKELIDLHYEDQLFTIEEAFQEQFSASDERYSELEAAYADYQEKLTDLADKEAKNRERIEESTTNTIAGMHESVWRQIAGTLRKFAGDNKLAAIAAIGIDKALNISQIRMNAETAKIAALKLPPGIAEARILEIESLAGISTGIVAATGLGEAAALGSGGGGGGSGGGGGRSLQNADQAAGLINGGGFAEDQGRFSNTDNVTVVVNMYGNNYGFSDFDEAVSNSVRSSVRNDNLGLTYNGESVTVS